MENKKSLILAPRGSLKTTVLTIARSVYKILRDFLLFDNRKIMIGIGSENKGKATAMVLAIRRHFENPRFQSLFGDLRGEIWREDELTFKGAKLQEKEANVTAFGLDSSAVSSRHFTDLEIDDPVSFENAQTFASRQKLWDRFLFDVLPTLEPDAENKELHIRGTRYHPDDVYGRELKKPTLTFRREKAILDDGFSFWERMFPIEKLLKMQRDNPAVFAAQYQNDVGAMLEMAPIKIEWVKPYDFATLQRHGLYYQIAVDPGGITEREETSGMGISVIGAQSLEGESFGNIYALESHNLHVDTWTGSKVIVDLWERYDKPEIVIEEVALQKVFQDIVDKEAKLRKHPWINVRGIKSSELKDKVTLARGVTHFFTRGQVFIDDKKTPQLYGNVADYPQHGTDDVNALLINLKHLKDHWTHRIEESTEVHEKRDPFPHRKLKGVTR